ncbi:hypothetical protein EDB83DRAFT_1172795 [Lactarius deliciosus]|nr:hypothetical protein EDB83DRAFT_1172795 [Lactarius deliciosus]
MHRNDLEDLERLLRELGRAEKIRDLSAFVPFSLTIITVGDQCGYGCSTHVKEYESRLKAAEERVKRERAGSKERVAELENNLKNCNVNLSSKTQSTASTTGICLLRSARKWTLTSRV